MDSDTISFGAPLAGLFVGLGILVLGIFLAGIGPVAFVGGAVAVLAIGGLARAAFRVERTDVPLERAERASDDPHPARGAKR